MYYVYIIRSKKNGQLYIGQTEDLRRRFIEHNQGLNKSTKSYSPYELIYYEAYKSARDAIARERQLKHFKQGYTRLKERLVYSLEEQS
ncbi:MAG: hypothetical protein A2941_00835 [Candidatus Yanofskybacteria bacterium RIFCSPLOWO2_01_FULL_49_17]|uniref:GIY-YIG domain-containing protein n=1 Tax=Candidatus Yanofskybacteria bacterium RIFCSPLOWO2_01_FULL_49_17 TaxID=1802700 RepID=A0A1F8GTA6_9BACT|nr:MAG: hypothetical protein A2941_00835 [Candidatus Yanofskybacteria bacterium RIFCSPLOWO2_01_FULL_49_17]